MAQDTATNDSRSQPDAERLRAIRARVADLHRRIKAERAYDIGLVNELTESGQVLSIAGTRCGRRQREANGQANGSEEN